MYPFNEWQDLPPRPVASLSTATEFNKRMLADLAFISILCEHPSDPDGRDLILSHTLDEATEFRLAPVLTNKRVPAIKLGFWRWGEIFGLPGELTIEVEGVLLSKGRILDQMNFESTADLPNLDL